MLAFLARVAFVGCSNNETSPFDVVDEESLVGCPHVVVLGCERVRRGWALVTASLEGACVRLAAGVCLILQDEWLVALPHYRRIGHPSSAGKESKLAP